MKIFIKLLIILLLVGCYTKPNSESNENIKRGAGLAIKQDSLFQMHLRGDSIPQTELDSLKNNLWIETAEQLAPSNLVIRNFCLIDIIQGTTGHYGRIHRILDLLSYNGFVWAEGYSYWQYTRVILDEWIKKFQDEYNLIEIRSLIRDIDIGFRKTAYLRGKMCYPAPFGDVRDMPLDSALQANCIEQEYPDTLNLRSIVRIQEDSTTVKYILIFPPVGLNTHVIIDTLKVTIINGDPQNFNFYQGYDKKYKSKRDESRDLFDSRRIESVRELN